MSLSPTERAAWLAELDGAYAEFAGASIDLAESIAALNEAKETFERLIDELRAAITEV